MLSSDRKIGRRFGFALLLVAASTFATAGEDTLVASFSRSASLEIPHTTNLQLDYQSRRRQRAANNIESSQLLEPTPGLKPLQWPRNSDVRARLLTPEVRRTPLVGWVAQNLYRSKQDNGWCLEVDPGQGEYIVFYRRHLK